MPVTINGTSGLVTATTFSGSSLSGIDTGKILQVKQAIKTDVSSTTSTSFSEISDFTQSITTIANSKVYVTGQFYFGSNPAYSTWFRLVRVDANGSTVYPYIGDAAGTTTRCSGGNYSGYYNYQGEHSSFNFLDTPSGAGTHSYKIEWKQGYSGYTSYIGRDQQGSQDPTRGRIPSSLTLMEVAG